MIVTKKLKDLTKNERLRCGWIEKIAYRGATEWTMFDFESENFGDIKRMMPKEYDKIQVSFGEKWFAIYRVAPEIIKLIDIAKMDIGKGQADAQREIKYFTEAVINSGKYIMVVARESTSYFPFAKMAMEGEIEIFQDEKRGMDLRNMIFRKTNGEVDLEEQKERYKDIVEKLTASRAKNKTRSNAMLKRYIEELEATIGKEELSKIVER